MMSRARLIPLGFLLLIALGCQRAAPPPVPSTLPEPTAQHSAEELKRVIDRYWAGWLLLNPTQASRIGDRRLDGQLEDSLSLQYLADSLALERTALTGLESVSTTGMDAGLALNLQIFKYEREVAIQGFVYPQELLALNPFEGMPLDVALMGAGNGVHAFADARGYEDWLRRIDGFERWSHTAIDNLREGERRGYLLPRSLVDRLLLQLAELAQDRNTNPFYAPLREFAAGVPAADRPAITQRMNAAIKDKLLPAYQSLHDFLRNEYAPRVRASNGLSALPMGEAWYAYCVRRATTTSMTPTQVHALGVTEVERARARLQDAAAQSGFAGNLPAFFEFLARDPRFYGQSAQQILDAYNALKAQVTTAAPTLFETAPIAALEVRALEDFRKAAEPAARYGAGFAQGKPVGIFYVNTGDPGSRPTFATVAQFLNQGIPGLHYQGAVQRERAELPPFRRFGTVDAFAQGWGAYAESLGDELGVNVDPYQRLGALVSELRRAARLVADSGLHAKGWSRQQTIDYLRAQTPLSDNDAALEVDRMLAMPGRALAAEVAELNFKALRARASATLGSRFDIRAFHAELLKDGGMPLEVLDAKMDRWIKTKAYNPPQ